MDQKYSYQGISLDYASIKPTPPKWWQKLLGYKSPKLLFLHGLNDPYQIHQEYLAEIAKYGYEVWAINLPGHGGSEQLATINWEVLVDIVECFIREKALEPLTLAGFSMGCGIALIIASRNRTKISGLKLIAPFCYPFSYTDITTAGGIVKNVIQMHQDQHTSGKPTPDHNLFQTAYVLRSYSHLFNSFPAKLNEITVPVDVLLLEQDAMISSSQAQQALREVPNSRVQIVPNLCHDLYYITHEQIVDLAQRLFKKGTIR